MPEQVDIPITVPPKTARAIADDLEESGKVTLDVYRSEVPDLVEQIRWQLENGQELLEFADEYRIEEDNDG
jgi:hypothetical protein